MKSRQRKLRLPDSPRVKIMYHLHGGLPHVLGFRRAYPCIRAYHSLPFGSGCVKRGEVGVGTPPLGFGSPIAFGVG